MPLGGGTPPFGLGKENIMHVGPEVKIGDKVVYDNPTGGYDYDQDKAEDRLVLNGVYTVSLVRVDKWRTEVYLEGVGGSFNSVLFSYQE